jgi:hypothetical protein
MVVYINTNVDSKDKVIKIIAKEFGIGRTTSIVDNWYEKYSEVLYDEKTLNLVFFKNRYAGYWESDKDVLKDFKIELE